MSGLETKPICGNDCSDEYLNCLPNTWEDRIRVQVAESEYGLAFWKSKAFRAYCSYFTQCGFRYFFRAANADAVYWFRNTKNLAIRADITASSGEKKYLNDFALANIQQVNDAISKMDQFALSAWIPNAADKERSFTLKWNQPVDVSTIKLYQNFRYEGHIHKLEISMNNGFSQEYLCSNSDVEILTFEVQKNISELTLYITDAEGKGGVREIEIFENDGSFPWSDVPLHAYQEPTTQRKRYAVKYYQFMADVFWFVLRAINKILKLFHHPGW